MTLTARWGDNILDSGFLALPNILLDKQEELGISDDELLFIIKTMRHHESFKIHDSQLSGLSTKTLQRRRTSLKEKGYLETEVHKYQDTDGTWITEGISYNYKNLIMAINALNVQASTERAELAKKVPPKTVHHNTIDNTSRKNKIPADVEKFMSDYKTHYGTDYKLTSTEKLLLENSSPEFIKSAPFIFDYTSYQKEYGKLPSTFVPRLIFFQKVLFRQAELIEFANQELEYLDRHKDNR